MPTGERLAIIIPAYKSQELTLKCLASLDRQPQSDLEVWVVDDASQDGTCDAVRSEFPSVNVLETEQRQGFTAAVNRGLRAARSDLLLLLNNDTELAPGALHALAAAFARHSRLGVAGAHIRYPDGRRQWSGGADPTLTWLFALASGLPAVLQKLPGYRLLRSPRSAGRQEPLELQPVEWVTGAALAIRRQTLEQTGLLDEEFVFYCQDLDLCDRARKHGWKVALVGGFAVVHHHGATIGRDSVAFAGQQRPDLLWSDLLLWAAKHRGDRWRRHARRMLATGTRLRLFIRRLARPFVAASRQESWRQDHRALRSALRALRTPSFQGSI